MTVEHGVSAHDRVVLRVLAEWQAEEAVSTRNREKVASWFAHDEGAAGHRPMVLVEQRYWDGDHGPVRERDLACEGAWARGREYRMRMLRHHVEVIQDDHVAPPFIAQHPVVRRSGFGVAAGRHREAGADRYAFNFRDAPLKLLDERDFSRLRPSRTTVDREAMQRDRERLESVFEGILPVALHDSPWQFHLPLTSTAFGLVGLEGFKLLIYDNPDGLHRLMAFLRDQQMDYLNVLEQENILPLNNGADYIGAGSVGYTCDLPGDGFSGHVRTIDRWGGFESQESVSISPEQYGEFVFAYMVPLMARFGKVYYGCCEPIDPVWEYLAQLPNLARVSVSPWADEAVCGRLCRQHGLVYSRKPSPNHISAARFDDGALYDHFLVTADAARGCRLEIIQRDVYVTANEPERQIRWVALAREACREAWCAASAL